MGTTTFSGPVKAGTVREGASANTGSVLMAQSAVIDIIGATNTTAVGIIPANSQIVDVILNVTTVSNDGGTATVQVGHAGDTDEYLPATNVKALGTTRGRLVLMVQTLVHLIKLLMLFIQQPTVMVLQVQLQ